MRQLERIVLSGVDGLAAAAVGVIAPILPLDQALPLVLRLPPEHVIAYWRQNRVLGIALTRLAAHNAELPAAWAQAVATQQTELNRKATLVRSTWQYLQQTAVAAGVKVWGIKGLAVETCYPEGLPRDMGDVDAMVATADDAWTLAATLRADGWDYAAHELPWLKRRRDGVLYGQVVLERLAGGLPARIDIHFGGYSLRHNACIPLPDALTTTGQASPTENMAYLIANAAGDFVVRLKEVNDLAACVLCGNVDWPRVLEQVRATGLVGFWNALVDATLSFTALPQPHRSILRGLRLSGVAEECPAMGVPDIASRRRVIIRHAAHMAGPGLKHRLRAIVSAALYYAYPLKLRTVRLPGLPIPGLLTSLREDRCVRLIPAQESAADAAGRRASPAAAHMAGSTILKRLELGGCELALAGQDVFVPTVYYLISNRTLRIAAELQRQLRLPIPKGTL